MHSAVIDAYLFKVVLYTTSTLLQSFFIGDFFLGGGGVSVYEYSFVGSKV